MTKESIIEQIVRIINQIEDIKVLKDILTLVRTVYKHSRSGTWGR